MSSRRYTVPRSEPVAAPASLRVSEDLRRLLYALGLLVVVTALVVLYLSQAGRVARKKEHMWTLEGEIQQAKRANVELMLQISRAQELKSLQERARALGFAEAQAVEYVEVPVNAHAMMPTLSPSIEGAEGKQGQQLPTWLQRLIWQFGEWARSNAASAAATRP